MKFLVGNQRVDPTSVGVQALGYAQPVTNRQTASFSCALSLEETRNATRSLFTEFVEETAEEHEQGILEPEYEWVVKGWGRRPFGIEFAANTDFVLRVILEFMAQEFAMKVLDTGKAPDTPEYVVNRLDYLHSSEEGIVFGGIVFIPGSTPREIL